MSDMDSRARALFERALGLDAASRAAALAEARGTDPNAVDSRSDVYALGVVLYELLAGRPPIDVSGLSLLSAASRLRDTEPAPLGRLRPHCRGDLEAICAKALEKDPDRRYASCAELAADIRRSLADEPVNARPLTAMYQLRKFAARSRGLASAAAAVALAVVVGSGVAVWQASVARTRAEHARQTLAILERMIETATPEISQGREITVRQMLDDAQSYAVEDPSLPRAVVGQAKRILGRAYSSLGNHERALPLLTDARQLLAAEHGAESRQALGVARDAVTSLKALDRDAEALSLAEELLATSLRVYGPDDTLAADARSTLAFADQSDDAQRSVQLHREALAAIEKAYGPDSYEARRERSNLGVALVSVGELDDAREIFERVLRERTALFGELHPDTLIAMNNVVLIHARSDQPDKAIPLCKQLVERSVKVLGDKHPSTDVRVLNLANVSFAAGAFAEAKSAAAKLLTLREQRLGTTHAKTLEAMGMLATAEQSLGELPAASARAKELYTRTVEATGERSADSIRALTLLFDLAGSNSDVEEMRRIAVLLKGTEYESKLPAEIEAAEARRAKALSAGQPPAPPTK